MYPQLVIDRKKLRHNAEALCRMAMEHGVTDMAFVTKAFSADEEMVRTIMEAPCRYMADSRIENLRRFGEGAYPAAPAYALTGRGGGAACGDQLPL